MITKPRQKFIYLENEKSFNQNKKSFIIFKELSVAKTCVTPKNAPLNLVFKYLLKPDIFLESAKKLTRAWLQKVTNKS